MARRGLFLACFVCSAFGAAFAATDGPVSLDFTPFGADHAANGSAKLAPADTSFGHYPMSISGIENAIHRYDGTKRLDDGPIAYAIVAIRDWEARFPRDPWIARELLAMQRVYEHAKTFEGVTYARRVAVWLQTDYAETAFARASRAEIAKFPSASDTSMTAPVTAHEPDRADVATSPEVRAAATPAVDVWSRFRPLEPNVQPT